jgi:2-hydroxy-6-oxonona-2,4-dienedioate hydrolase
LIIFPPNTDPLDAVSTVSGLTGSPNSVRLIPKCELHMFFDCGHWAMIERKAEFEDVLGSFFRRPSASGAAA